MGILFLCRPPGMHTIAPPDGAPSFAQADLVALLGGPIQIVPLRDHGTAIEVLVVRLGAEAEPVNLYASGLLAREGPPALRGRIVRGDAIRCMYVNGAADAFV